MNLFAVIALLAGVTVAETVHGVVIFTRHGDRTTKHYGNQQLTPLGATQNFQVGSSYRMRYLDLDSEHRIRGIAPDKVQHSQIYASAPNQAILSNTAISFLQGLYPPLSLTAPDLAFEELNNGSDSYAPLFGNQYVHLQAVDKASPNSIWLKGDDSCPAQVNSFKSFIHTPAFKKRLDATRGFYSKFYRHLEDVYDISSKDMSYAKAYTIWDLLNTARIHNRSTSALDISSRDMFQLRTLADSLEFSKNYHPAHPELSIGGRTLAGNVLFQLRKTVASGGQLKLSVMAGSYDTFLSFFGNMGLPRLSDDFRGLPEYASTMVFELFSEGNAKGFPSVDDLRVRWMFKNGTRGGLKSYPLFGQKHVVLPYTVFFKKMQQRAISDVGTWCKACSSPKDFCAVYRGSGWRQSSESQGHRRDGISNAAAGVIGATVTFLVLIAAVAVAFVMTRRKMTRAASAVASPERTSMDSESSKKSENSTTKGAA